jgi:hypothetical protein
MANVLFPLVGGLAWAVCLYKLAHLIRQPNLQSALLCGMIAFPATSYLVAWPWMLYQVDRVLGSPNLSTLIVYTGVVLFALCAQLWLVVVTYPPMLRRRRMLPPLVGFVVALAAMALLFAVAPVHGEETDQFDAKFATAAWVPEFLLVYLAAFAAGLVGVAQLCRRWARQAERVALRRGLWLIAAGAAVAMGYVLTKAAYVALRATGTTVEGLNAVSPLFASFGSLLLLAGFITPAVPRAITWIRRWRTYQHIHPLWQQLVAAVPDVVLPGTQGPRRPWMVMRNLDTLLYRRVVECRDARLLLRPWIDLALGEQVRRRCQQAGVTGIAVDAEVEAALLRAALQAKTIGPAAPATRAADGDEEWTGRGGGELNSETRWLHLVADRFVTKSRGMRTNTS